MSESAPTFLVVGAGRSGTTGLVEGLRTHPAVFVTTPKEPHYFALHGQSVQFRAPGDEATINRVAVTDDAAYRKLYQGVTEPVRGDGSVSSLYYWEAAVPKIREVNPEMRIVILLREPVDRAFSSFQYMSARGFEPEESFAAACADEERRMEDNWHHLWHYKHMSLYSDAVNAYIKAFGDQVGIWFYDEMQSDYETMVSQVLRHIGAPRVEGEAQGVPRVNISGAPRSKVAHRAIWAATKNEAVRSTVKRLSTYRMREFVRRAALKSDAVQPRDRERLAPYFRDDLGELSQLLPQQVADRAPAWLQGAEQREQTKRARRS